MLHSNALRRTFTLLVLFVTIMSVQPATLLAMDIDPRSHGAKADGQSLDTKAIQASIDSCSKAGGGRVIPAGGTFVTGTLQLKSKVQLHLEMGAVLKASDDLEHFPSNASKHPAYTGEFVTLKAMIYAEDAHDIAITGLGTIDGNGDHWAKGPMDFHPSVCVPESYTLEAARESRSPRSLCTMPLRGFSPINRVEIC